MDETNIAGRAIAQPLWVCSYTLHYNNYNNNWLNSCIKSRRGVLLLDDWLHTMQTDVLQVYAEAQVSISSYGWDGRIGGWWFSTCNCSRKNQCRSCMYRKEGKREWSRCLGRLERGWFKRSNKVMMEWWGVILIEMRWYGMMMVECMVVLNATTVLYCTVLYCTVLCMILFLLYRQ